jgi:hypothetical protein
VTDDCGCAGELFDPYHMGAIGPPRAALAVLDALPSRRPAVADPPVLHSTSALCPRHLAADVIWLTATAPDDEDEDEDLEPVAPLDEGPRCGVCRRRLVNRENYRAELEKLLAWCERVLPW